MSLLVDENSKEQQRINELQRQLDARLAKQNKDETRQKILLGAFLLELLEQDKVAGLRHYTVEHLNTFLKREGDKTLLSPVVNNVKNLLDQKVSSPVAHEQGDLLSTSVKEVSNANG